MKKGKLLAAINMMSFAVLSAGMAGTFAWYTVNASQNVAVAANNTGDLVVGQNATGQGAAYVSFSVSWTQDATYDAAHVHFVDDSGSEYIWQNGTLISAVSGNGMHPYGKMTVQLGNVLNARDLSTGQATDYADLSADQKAVLSGRYTMRVTSINSRVHIFASAPNDHYITGNDTITVSATLGKTSATPIENNAVSFYYTIEGENLDEDDVETPDEDPIIFGFRLNHVSYVPTVA